MGKTINTYAMCTLVTAESDAAAEAQARRYEDGVDTGAIIGMLRSWGMSTEAELDKRARLMGAFMTQTAIGSPATCAEKLEHFLEDCALDGVMLIFPDYVEGLNAFGREIMPKMTMAPA